MDCAEEVMTLRRELQPLLPTETRLTFDVMARLMLIDGPSIETPRILEAISRTGLRGELVTERESTRESAQDVSGRGLAVATASSGLATALGFCLHVRIAGVSAAIGGEGAGVLSAVPSQSIWLYAIAITCGVIPVLRKAWFAATRLRPDMNLLMTLAVAGAVVIGEWFEAATVSFLFASSLALEGWSIGRARRAVAALLDLSPPTARVRTGSREESQPVEEIPVGTLVLVHPGERVPLDGVVELGTSSVDQAPITGESVPVTKQAGAEVFAGSINGEGALEIRTARASGDTTLAKIIRMVRDSQARRAKSERWVDRFAAMYTPAVLCIALAMMLIPPLAGLGTWSEWFYRSLVLLVIACPCALVISTPVAMVSGLTAAARAGVLIKGGEFLEAPSTLRAIAFDKTGTITAGRLSVVSVVPLSGHTETELLLRAIALEMRSEHPLAKAIVAHGHTLGLTSEPASDVRMLAGKGVTGRIDGREFWIGSHRHLEERGQETPEVHAQLESMTRQGRSVVVVGNSEHACGFIGLVDTPRPAAKATLDRLRALGVGHLVMLTGDNRGTADAVNQGLRFDEVHAELLPEDKVAAVKDLMARYGAVAMVGDGVNDAPALATASMSIAMGAAGSDAAIETADVALMGDDLSRLPWLIEHSRRVKALIQQNIGLSLATKAIFLVLALTGRANLWTAIAADMGTSLVVILNAMRLLRTRAD